MNMKSKSQQRGNGLSRRHFIGTAALAGAALLLAPRRVFADDESPVIIIRGAAASAKIKTTKLRNNISVLEGSGGNIAVLTGNDGKVLVDAGIAASRPRISEALGNLGPEPIKHLINTHWHFDHTDGNEWLHSEGAEITAHENTRKRLSESTRVDAWDFTFPPSPAGALPTKLFSMRKELELNRERIVMKHYPPAHTDSDISVEFTQANILHVGDTWWNGYFPFIDYNTGGSIDGAIHAAKVNIARVSSDTIVIPGHGPIGGLPELIDFRDMLVTVRNRIARFEKEGRTMDEILAKNPTAEYDDKWGSFVINGKMFSTLVYAGV